MQSLFIYINTFIDNVPVKQANATPSSYRWLKRGSPKVPDSVPNGGDIWIAGDTKRAAAEGRRQPWARPAGNGVLAKLSGAAAARGGARGRRLNEGREGSAARTSDAAGEASGSRLFRHRQPGEARGPQRRMRLRGVSMPPLDHRYSPPSPPSLPESNNSGSFHRSFVRHAHPERGRRQRTPSPSEGPASPLPLTMAAAAATSESLLEPFQKPRARSYGSAPQRTPEMTLFVCAFYLP